MASARGWIYDLWLVERLAAKLDARPLPDVRLTEDWTPPYVGAPAGPCGPAALAACFCGAKNVLALLPDPTGIYQSREGLAARRRLHWVKDTTIRLRRHP